MKRLPFGSGSLCFSFSMLLWSTESQESGSYYASTRCSFSHLPTASIFRVQQSGTADFAVSCGKIMPEAKLDPTKVHHSHCGCVLSYCGLTTFCVSPPGCSGQRLAAALMLRGLQVQCVSAWGTLREVVLRLQRTGSDVQICWTSAEPRPDLCISLQRLIDAVPGRHLKQASGQQAATFAVAEERMFALVFQHSFVLQLQASDQQTAQEVCKCLKAVATGTETKRICTQFNH